MAEDNKLEDLILEEPEEGTKKSKGILVILGLVVLLLIIGVVLVNIIFKSGDDLNASQESIKDEIVQDIETNKMDNNLSIKDENLKIDDDLAPLEEKDNLDTKMAEKEDNIKDDIIAGASVVTAGAAAKKAVENKIEKDEILEEEPKKVEKKEKRVVKKEHKVKRKPRIREVERKVRKHINYGGNVYIQVGSFSKGPSSEFINKIRRAGFKYRIKEVNGFRRVLIGPFRNSNEAKRYLGTIRARISSSAFIKR